MTIPQSMRTGGFDAIVPSTTPPLRGDGTWLVKEWPMTAVGDGGVELMLLGRRTITTPPLPFPPLGTMPRQTFELVLKHETIEQTIELDAAPGARISLPETQFTIRACLQNTTTPWPNLAQQRYRWQWAASQGNGSRGYRAPTITFLPQTILAGNTGARIRIPIGARSVTVLINQSGLLSQVLVREYADVDGSTVIWTEAASTREMPVDALGGQVAVINGSAVTIAAALQFNLFM